LAVAAVVMLALDSLVNVVSGVVAAHRIALIDRLIMDQGSVDPAEAQASDWLSSAVGGVEAVVYVATGVMFLVWLWAPGPPGFTAYY
jgi:hypothetical protein